MILDHLAEGEAKIVHELATLAMEQSYVQIMNRKRALRPEISSSKLTMSFYPVASRGPTPADRIPRNRFEIQDSSR
jgi:hypothetical protein